MFEIYSKINGGIVKTSRTTKLRFQVEDILNKINSKTKIIFLAQPNNPTGFYLNKKELSKLVKKVPKRIIIILDAAYAEYMTDNEYSTGIDYAKKNKNIIVTRTFSKIYGIASLRLGWCYAHRDIINLMNKIRGPFNVNHVAQEAGIAALRDKKHQLKAIKHNKYWLEKMKFKLSQLPIHVHDSRANFLLLDVGKNASKLNRFLLSKSIIVRTMEKYGLKNCIRVSIGKSKENIKLLEVMDRFYK
jgi:histidinol-phosphate aminotransferase